MLDWHLEAGSAPCGAPSSGYTSKPSSMSPPRVLTTAPGEEGLTCTSVMGVRQNSDEVPTLKRLSFTIL